MAIKVVQEIDIDERTLTVSESNPKKLQSVFLLTDKEATVPLNQIQQLIFRQTENCNYPMVCTGLQVGGKWYGDRPDNGEYINPFTNQVVQVGQPEVPKKSIRFVETYQGIQVHLINWDASKLPDITFTQYAGISTDEYANWDQPDPEVDNWVFQSSNTLMAFANSIEVRYRKPDATIGYYQANVPAIEARQDGTRTYGFEGLTEEEVLRHFQIVTP